MKETDKKYEKDAIEIIDMIFEKGYFHEEVTRADLRAIDELLAYFFQSNVNSALRCKELTRKIRETQTINNEGKE